MTGSWVTADLQSGTVRSLREKRGLKAMMFHYGCPDPGHRMCEKDRGCVTLEVSTGGSAMVSLHEVNRQAG